VSGVGVAELGEERVLLLARHGETDWNREGRWQGNADIPLNERGRAQAGELAERLRPFAPIRAFASDLRRAAETARIAALRLGLDPPELVAGLRERSYGVWEGRTKTECERDFPGAWALWLAGQPPEPPGSEPRELSGARVAAALGSIALANDFGGRPAFVVSHGGVLRAFLLRAFGIQAPPLGNGALWEVRWNEGAFRTARPVGE
jgi:probable phosphoglycerate mutase